MPRTDRRRLLFALAAASLAASALPVAAQSTFDLGQLTQLLATVKAGDATFTEKRTVTMLERTLESSGRLSFEAPDTFVRETLKPRQERMSVVGNQVTLSQGSRGRTVPLDSVPEAAVIVEAIRGTLTGNREVLDRNFTANVTGNAVRWTLELLPRAPRLRELVASVRVSGEQALVREVIVAMSDGDRSVMTITPLAGAMPATSTARAASAPN